jgi:CheY-like chemotaxis protein
VGFSELALSEDISAETRDHLTKILENSQWLLQIINDILDISKIESGTVNLEKIPFNLHELLAGCQAMFIPRAAEKGLSLHFHVEPTPGKKPIGDPTKLRQSLVNLLSNAIKFTDFGSVKLQVIIKNISGTGLGLAITKKLCSIMNGSINMESEYGAGSIFTITIPQGIASEEPFAAVDNAKNKKVLVYEGRVIYAMSVCWSLENMGVPHKMVTTIDDFSEALFNEEWALILSGYGLHEKIKQVMKNPDASYLGGKKPPLALMVEWGTEAYIPNVRFVSLPIQSLSIANVLNGKADNKNFSDITTGSSIFQYSFPNARILVVDDIPTNLKVAEGLLFPYGASVDTCLSGPEAIEFVKHYNYDIVFMDHMMPEMDGIETTAIIRDWEKEKMHVSRNEIPRIPIVALTANAVSGVREMFILKGFDDFLAKPIDISALDEVINRLISKEKRERGYGKFETWKTTPKLPRIEGIDIQKGITMTGGTESGFLSVLATFCKDAKERLKCVRTTFEEDRLTLFTTHVHALKSASASIGAAEISSQAAKLENAGREWNKVYIHANIDIFIESLSKLIAGISYALEAGKPENSNEQVLGNKDEFVLLLKKLEEALKSQKADDIDHLLDNINKQPMDEKTKENIEKISDDILMTEFDSAIKTIKETLKIF